MNIPNFLTLLRIILVPAIVIFLMQDSFFYALLIFIIAGITDGLDGFLARTLKQKTVLGSYLDPLADKALIIASFITLSILNAIPGWLAVVVISRDVIILFGVFLLFFMSVPFEVRPSLVSKVTTVFQLMSVLIVLLYKCFPRYIDYHMIEVIFWITVILTVISGLAYMCKGIKYINNTGGHSI